MPSLFAGINVAMRAMLAHQQAIDVIEHNVSNANTQGYHRQSAVLSAGMPTALSSFHNAGAIGQVGTGVTVDKIQRFSLDYFDTRYRREVTLTNRWQVESDTLQQVEAQMAEYGSDGLIKKLDAFWGSWQSLSADASNPNLRADLLDNAKSLAMAFNRRAEVLVDIRRDISLSVEQTVNEVNTLADQIAALNQEIVHVTAAGEQPNDLMDKRDIALDRLSELTGAQCHIQSDNSALVSINGHSLVFGVTTYKLVVSKEPLTSSIKWEDGANFYTAPSDPQGVPSALAELSGKLAGLLNVRDNIIPSQQKGLDQLAYEMVNAVNSIHNPDMTATPPPSDPPYHAAGMNFFNPLSGVNGAAGMISVSSDMEDLRNIIGASAGYPGDGAIARLINNLQSKTIAGLNGMTANEYYTNQASSLGMLIKNAGEMAKSRKNVSDALAEQRESLVGVSLDEEAANLVRSQRAFEAASRMLNVMDEMLDRIINQTGLVGR